ncbi:MAG: hypothetical protein AABY86_16920, partial [Bdellovibrionota bacterium]
LMLEKLEKGDISHELQPHLRLLAQNLAISMYDFMPINYIFDTLLTRPGDGYEERSGSALMGILFVKGAQLKILPPEFFQAGVNIYAAITARLRSTDDGLSMPDISGPTIPYPKLGYKVVPRGRDYPYGIGAYLLLAEAVSGEQAF